MAHLASRLAPHPAPPGAPSPRRAPPASSPHHASPRPRTTTSNRHAPSLHAPSRPHPSTSTSASSTNMNGSSAGGAAAPERRPASASASSAPPSTASPAPAAPSGPRDDFAADQRPIILFDGVCNLCNRGVNFMLDNDPRGAFRLAALQSPAGRRLLARCGRSPDDISSIVLVDRDRCFTRSEAILRIGAALRVPLPLLAAFGFPVPLPLRDAFYDAVANNRYSFFGRTDACRLRDAGKFTDRFVVD